MYINNVLYCFYSSDTEALEACFRLLHDDDDDDTTRSKSSQNKYFLLSLKWFRVELGLINLYSCVNAITQLCVINVSAAKSIILCQNINSI